LLGTAYAARNRLLPLRIHTHRLLDLNSQAEWSKDTDGSRIGTRRNYGEYILRDPQMEDHADALTA